MFLGVKQILVRTVAVFALGAGAVSAGFSASHPTLASAQQAATPDRAAVVRGFIGSLSNWDVEGQVAAFAANAVFIGGRPSGNCSQQTPCSDPVSIRQQAQGNIAIHPCYTIRALQVSGAVVTGQLEVTSDTSRANGVSRTLQDFIAVVPADKITFFANVNDVADPLTALNAAISAGTQPAGLAIPNPTACGA